MNARDLAAVLDVLGDAADADHWRNLDRLIRTRADAQRAAADAEATVNALSQRLLDARNVDRAAAARAIADDADIDNVTVTAPAIEAELRAAREAVPPLKQHAADTEAAYTRHVVAAREAMAADLADAFERARQRVNASVDTIGSAVEAAATMRAMSRGLSHGRSSGFRFRSAPNLRVMVERGGHHVEVTAAELRQHTRLLPFAQQVER